MAGLTIEADSIGWGPRFVRGVFNPVRRDDLKPEMTPLIGRTLLWEYAGISNDDEPYPGQFRYLLWPDASVSTECYYRWSPLEDIEVVEIMFNGFEPPPRS